MRFITNKRRSAATAHLRRRALLSAIVSLLLWSTVAGFVPRPAGGGGGASSCATPAPAAPAQATPVRAATAEAEHAAVCHCRQCGGGAGCCCAKARTPGDVLVLLSACDRAADPLTAATGPSKAFVLPDSSLPVAPPMCAHSAGYLPARVSAPPLRTVLPPDQPPRLA